jgi:hypothetical protein
MKKIKSVFIYSAIISAVVGFSKCSFREDINEVKESLKDFTVYLTTPNLSTGVHLEFVDARTNEILENKDVKVIVSGKDASHIYNNIGSKQESYTSNWGVLDLVIDPHKADSIGLSTNPIQFEVTASLQGYVSETQPVSIYDISMQTIRIPLININNPPEGVAFTQTEIAISTTEDGSISDDMVVELSGNSQGIAQRMKGQAASPNVFPSLVIPKGIKLYSGNQPLKSLSVTAQIVNFPENGKITFPDQRLARFDHQGYMFRFGSIKLTIKATQQNGQTIEVSRTDNGFLTLQLALPNNYIDPLTMMPIKENDIIERFNFDTFKLTKDPVKKINGKFVVESLLGRYPTQPQQYGKMLPSCSNGAKSSIIFDFDVDNIRKIGQGSFVYQIITTKENKIIAQSNTSYGFWELIESKFQVPLTEGSAKVVFFSNGKLKFTPDTLLISNMCEDRKYFVGVESATANSGKNWINLNLDISIMSETNNNYVIKPSIILYYGQQSESYPLNLKNGKASFTILEGSQYYIRAALGNSRAEGLFKIETDSPTTYKVTFTKQLTSTTGNPVTIIVPKTENNEVTLKYDIPVSDNLLGSFN